MRNRAIRFVFLAPLAIAAVFLFAWIVMLLWNNALVPATGWHLITYWQAFGVLILAKILFGFGGGHHGGMRHRMGRRAWANWQSLTPEEREKFRETMRARYGSSWCEPRPPHGSEAPADR
jgi:Spy/CpxP family protein refolding chaperone